MTADPTALAQPSPRRQLTAEARAIVRFAKAMLSCGAETDRVRRGMDQIAASLGIDRLQSQLTLSEVTVTLFCQGRFRTQVGNVHAVAVNADKLSQLELLTSQLPPRTTPTDIEGRIDAIDARDKLHAPWLQALATAVACTAVGFLNNAWAAELAAVFIGAFLGQLVKVWFGRIRLNVYLATALAALVAAAVFWGVATLVGGLAHSPAHSAGLVAVLIFLVPGFPLVNALLDLIKTDMTAGLSRLAYAFMILGSASIALMLAAGLGLASTTALPAPPIGAAPWWLLALAASGVGVAGWAVMFNASRRGALLSGLIGLAGNAVRLVLVQIAGQPIWLGAGVGCLLIGVAASLLARPNHLSAVTLCVPAALIMVPGVPAYRALTMFASGDITGMAGNAATAIFTIVAMAIGLSIARVLSDQDWILDARPSTSEALDDASGQ
ncbi:MAG: threonine/serine exporter family protein [Propionibacteriaceae bacterium]|nr:threonine/serine exporter family protein [Propionibacteriaceae bacterium]